MTVVIEPYPNQDLLSSPPFPLYHHQQHHYSSPHYSPQQQQNQPQDLSPAPYDLIPFDLGLLDLDLGLTLHIGGLNLQRPDLSSPFITSDLAADPWMASDHQYINPGGASPRLPPSHLSPQPAPAQSSPSTQQLQGIHQDSFQTRTDVYDHCQARYYLPRHGHTSPYLGDSNQSHSVAVDFVLDPTIAKQPRRHRQTLIFPQVPVGPTSPATTSTQVMEEHQRSWRNGPSYPLVDHRLPSSDFRTSYAAPGEWQIDQQTDAFTRPFTVLKPPKLSRTISDVYSDELYSPEFAVVSASPGTNQSAGNLDMSPPSGVFAKRVTVANLFPPNSATMPVSTLRDRSPFRQGSLLAPPASHSVLGGKGVYHPGRIDGSTASMMTSTSSATISPKDALLVSDHADGVERFTLFPTTPTNAVASGGSTGWNVIGLDDSLVTSPCLAKFSSQFSNQQRPASVAVPQTHPYTSDSLTSCSPVSPGAYFDPQRSSGSDSDSEYYANDAEAASRADILQKPFATATDEGTYTCTYHGCVLRFDSPLLLQRHKREGHRHPHGIGGLRAKLLDVGATGGPSGPGGLGVMGSQAGPHRCDRINPATNKPCSVLFSRPYDLTRHEDTIHNARKTKSRCRYCNEEKTFSRADALRRHYRVCHPEVEIRAKHRRRLNDGTSSIS